jgi:hypothetical protein
MTDQLIWLRLWASVVKRVKLYVHGYTNTEIKHFTYTSDFQTVVWDIQTLSECLPEKITIVFSHLSKFVPKCVVFLYFGFRKIFFFFLAFSLSFTVPLCIYTSITFQKGYDL